MWMKPAIGLRGAHVFLFYRFATAAKTVMDNDTARFDFDGSPRRWNGRTIKKKIQGNSTLYILESDQV